MKILIADDHAVVRQGVIQLLRTEYITAEIEEVPNGEEALSKALGSNWDLIILDISMPLKNGIVVVKEIRAAGIQTPILMLSMQPEDQYAVRAINAGASGYVNKDSATMELLTATRAILAGKKYASETASNKIAADAVENKGKANTASLSEREKQVLQLIASGQTLTEIAQETGLYITTISTYRTRLLEKLSLSNNAELTKYAIDNGLA